MEITIKNQQKKIPLNPTQIAKIAQRILRLKGIHEGFLSIVFVSEYRIRLLNKKYLHRNYATDVLAFDLKNSTLSQKSKTIKSNANEKKLEGEVIISVMKAFKNAEKYSKTHEEEIVLYIIHGILHLIGYLDHTSKEIQKMRKEESIIIEKLKPLPKIINKR